MKDFLKYVAATVVGIIAFLIVMGVFGMMSIIGMVASSEATKSVATTQYWFSTSLAQLMSRVRKIS